MQRLVRLAAALALCAPLACGSDSPAPDTTVASITLTGPGGAGNVALTSVGQTAQLTAAAKNAAGAAVSASFTWTSDAAAVATVDGTGLVTAVGAGSANLHARSGTVDQSIAATVTLAAAGPVATVTVSPASLVISSGGSGNFSATGKDANGVTNSAATFGWTSSDTTHGAVSSTGKVTAALGAGDFGAGPITITATSNNGKVGTATASVAVVNSWSFASGAAGDNVDVKQNQYVVFNNPDGTTQHSVVLDSPAQTLAAPFTNDATPAQVTLAPGSYNFHCGIHGTSMHGVLVVH